MESDVDWVVPYPGVPSAPPEPIQALRVAFRAADGTAYTAMVRRWTAASAAGCRLCGVCTARPGADGQWLCVVAVEGEAPEGLGDAGVGRPADAS
jgi:hypothetical protein